MEQVDGENRVDRLDEPLPPPVLRDVQRRGLAHRVPETVAPSGDAAPHGGIRIGGQPTDTGEVAGEMGHVLARPAADLQHGHVRFEQAFEHAPERLAVAPGGGRVQAFARRDGDGGHGTGPDLRTGTAVEVPQMREQRGGDGAVDDEPVRLLIGAHAGPRAASDEPVDGTGGHGPREISAS